MKTLKERKKGDTSESIKFVVKNKTTQNFVDLSGSSIVSQFRKGSVSGNIYGDFSEGNGITITDAANGEFFIDQIDKLDWDSGTYYWDVQILLSDGRTKTYVSGTMNVVETVSKP